MPAQLYVIDTSAERRDRKALQENRGTLLAYVGEIGHLLASPSERIEDDLLACNDYVCAMLKLINEGSDVLPTGIERRELRQISSPADRPWRATVRAL